MPKANEGTPFLNALESEALEQLAELRKYRTYQGVNNSDYAKRAKVALGVIGSYVRLRGTIANEQTNELVRVRLMGELDEKAPKALPRGGRDHDA